MPGTDTAGIRCREHRARAAPDIMAAGACRPGVADGIAGPVWPSADGPARDRTRGVNVRAIREGRKVVPRAAGTSATRSATSPRTAHRTILAPCAWATRSARAHATRSPKSAWSAAARAAMSAAPPARCRATTTEPIDSTTANTAHSAEVATATHTVAIPSSPRDRQGFRRDRVTNRRFGSVRHDCVLRKSHRLSFQPEGQQVRARRAGLHSYPYEIALPTHLDLCSTRGG